MIMTIIVCEWDNYYYYKTADGATKLFVWEILLSSCTISDAMVQVYTVLAICVWTFAVVNFMLIKAKSYNYTVMKLGEDLC